MNRDIFAIVLAGGKGTRMKSELPKVLHPVLGRPMIEYPLDALKQAGVSEIFVVVGYKAQQVECTIGNRDGLHFVLQKEQKGTGHAVQRCEELLRERATEPDTPVVIIAGDSPLMQGETIASLLADWNAHPAACLLGTIHVENPYGLGRILRDENGRFLGIVEEKDATDEQRKIREVNQSYYVFRVRDLLEVLGELQPNNAQGEYYITDAPALLLRRGREVRALPVLRACEAVSVNTPEELRRAEEILKNL
ncbi:MAG: NTP transferase domain-containing protein [Planctomycetia bacterium]|nr:NTP transferase domain-containing protein [Planctomycetia bacterium]